MPQVPGTAGDERRIKTEERTRLEPEIARPDGGIGAVQVPCLHDLGKRREFPQGIEVGVFLHVVVVGVAVLDRRLEQADGSLRTVTTFCRVFLGERLRGQGVGTGCIVVQSSVLRLFLECGVQLLERLVGSLAQFRCHDDRQVEPGTLGGVALLELLQIRPCLVLVTQPGMGDGSGL